MKTYDFDRVIDRACTCSIKTDFTPDKDALPLWIADMDFPVADEIVAALHARADHPIFGYTYLPDALFASFAAWHARRHGVRYDPAKVIPYYSVVSAIRLALAALTAKGDGVAIMTPVYMHFKPSVEELGRRVYATALVNVGGRYEIDFDDLERCLCRAKVLLLCSPHNPVGRVWTKTELERIVALCTQRGVILLSDEIHSDLVMPGYRNVPVMSLGGNVRDIAVTLLSATKTFNLAQSGMAFIYTENPAFEASIRNVMDAFHLGAMNVFAATAVAAAYEHGAAWLDQVLAYVYENYKFVAARLAATMPDIILSPMEGTYLLWLDVRKLGSAARDFFEREAKIYGDDGALFGPDGEGFYRLNIATPRSVVACMLDRMEKAYLNRTQ